MKKLVLGVIGVASCPCHLPLYLTLVGGTALGGFLLAYQGWLLTVMAMLFAGTIMGFLW